MEIIFHIERVAKPDSTARSTLKKRTIAVFYELEVINQIPFHDFK